jgi:putative transposase
MVVRRAYKFRLYPTPAQETLLEQTLETCREVYNSFLHWRKYDYEVHGASPSFYDQKKALPLWKENHPELSSVHSQVLQNVCKRVDLAYQAYFDRLADYQLRAKQGRLKIIHNELEKCPGPPRSKGRGSYDSITYPQAEGFTLGEGCITFSKLATIKAVLHRALAGVMKTATIGRQSGKWFVTFSCMEEAEPLPNSEASVGIDVGLENFATFSDDTEPIENPRFFRTEQKALAKAQRKLDQIKHKHRSPSRRKAKQVVARVHERIRNKRHNFHHQEARKIVNRYGIITVEKLNIANLTKSPAPKQDERTGTYLPNGHAAKAGLNRSILDAGWYSFRRILKSKAESAGREIYEINPAYTSQDCARCGYRPPPEERKQLSDRWHECPQCGYSVPRDKNSAILQDKIGMGLHTVRRRAVEAPAFTPGE